MAILTEIQSALLVVFILLLFLAPVPCGIYGIVQLFQKGSKKDFLLGTFSVAVTALSASGMVWLSVKHLQIYGLALFIGLPIYCGILPVLLYSWRKKRTYAEAIGITAVTLFFLGIAIILFALDGLICILMAAPLAAMLAFVAAVVTHLILNCWQTQQSVVPLLAACAMLPFAVGFEERCGLPPPTSVVISSVDIAATPETIWKFIPAIPPIPDAPELLFRTGLAYPLRSEMLGTGLGARRLCILSTGPLWETITVWQPGQLLRFQVDSCPPSMREFSIYPDLHPAHLENFMVSEWGQFKLIRLDATHTRLEGTSQYHNRMWPACYWMPISDAIVHRIHYRVLYFIKAQAEKRE